ncbi:9037_t:CDS:2 [Funneliformis mosseae]|uniref:9037_t:CDS:1 n=1 Tax=Funneliformis mosseae TaxID=27381 RepID=A0A9N9DRQ7_FUNMO|nr:9037_t:CDS:2 [Funneliformis mosseae]
MQKIYADLIKEKVRGGTIVSTGVVGLTTFGLSVMFRFIFMENGVKMIDVPGILEKLNHIMKKRRSSTTSSSYGLTAVTCQNTID